MTRSGKYADLANESATAAFLAESSSKESMMTRSSSANSASASANASGQDSSFASSGTATTLGNTSGATRWNSDEWEDAALGSSTGSGSGGKVSRKPSLVGRLLRGGKKKNG